MKNLLLAVFFTITLTSCFGQQQSSATNDNIAAVFDRLNNKPFAELQLEDTAGNIFNTATLLGKTIYVDVWFTACPPCIKEIPFSKSLQQFFAADTNVVFLNICIENIDRKPVWKQMIQEKQMKGIHLFYARNRPQKINLLREYEVTFPTYLLVNKQMRVIGYDAPRPSEKGFVQWAIKQAEEGILLSEAYRQMTGRSKEFREFINKNMEAINALQNP